MRTLWLVLALLVALVTPAAAKRIACAPPLAAPVHATGVLDVSPPAPPVVTNVRFEDRTLWIDARFSPDTDRIRIRYEVDGVATELWTTRDRLYVCTPAPVRGSMPVTIAAFDTNGNASATDVTGFVSYRGRYRCGLGPTVLMVIVVPVVAVLAGIVLLVVVAIRRHNRAKRGDQILLA